jgi:signal transduction histidine kinase
VKAEFLADMTHDLRSPLNTILGFAELMHEGSVGPVADDHKEYLGDILTSGRHLLRMIDDLLDLAKLEAGRTEGTVEAIDLAALVSGARALVEGRAAHRHIRIQSEVDAVTGIVRDLVLLDLHLPDMPGEEVLRHLFENPATRGVPVVVVTADATPGLTRRLQAAGATAFLTKPLDIRRVLHLIDEVLGAD